MKKNRMLLMCLAAVFCCGVCLGESSFKEMPVEEITVFKDGHAFVLHEGEMPVNKNSEVMLDYLPRPVIGTFWAYSADKRAKLKSVVSGRKVIDIDRTAMSIPELVEANAGKRVQIKEGGSKYEAIIVKVLKQSREELNQISPAGTDERLGVTSNIVMLKLAESIKAVQINRIEEITFLDDPKSSLKKEEFRNTMNLKFEATKRNMPEKLMLGWFICKEGFAGYQVTELRLTERAMLCLSCRLRL